MVEKPGLSHYSPPWKYSPPLWYICHDWGAIGYLTTNLGGGGGAIMGKTRKTKPKVYFNFEILFQAQCSALTQGLFVPRDDIRMQMCGNMDRRSLYTIFHEIGHVHYYLLYANQTHIYYQGQTQIFWQKTEKLFCAHFFFSVVKKLRCYKIFCSYEAVYLEKFSTCTPACKNYILT